MNESEKMITITNHKFLMFTDAYTLGNIFDKNEQIIILSDNYMRKKLFIIKNVKVLNIDHNILMKINENIHNILYKIIYTDVDHNVDMLLLINTIKAYFQYDDTLFNALNIYNHYIILDANKISINKLIE